MFCPSNWRVAHLIQFDIKQNKTTEILVHAFVSSKLDHCNSLLYNVPKCALKKLQSVQNASSRLITCSRKYDHITPILKEIHWLPISERIKFKIMLLTFKALHQQSPVYIQDLVAHYQPSRILRSSHLLLLNPTNFHLKTLFPLLNSGTVYLFLSAYVTI